MLGDLPIHPMVVHFPIALLIVGFLVELAGRLLRRPWLGHAALLLLILGALGAVAAARTGEAAEETVLETPAIEEVLEEHEEGGKQTMWLFLGLAALRSVLAWLKRDTAVVGWIFLVLWAGGLVLLYETAHHGGELVYKHGAGVAATAPVAPGD